MERCEAGASLGKRGWGRTPGEVTRTLPALLLFSVDALTCSLPTHKVWPLRKGLRTVEPRRAGRRWFHYNQTS